jgi:DNA-binding GntR family transcriptional regulator
VNREHEIAARFGLSPTSRLVRIERVRSAGDEPVALEICYLSDEECHAYAPLDRASLFTTLERECGIELAYADEEVDATHADLRIARLLNIPNGSPLLRIRQRDFTVLATAAPPGHHPSIDSSLRGFGTASLSAFSVDPQYPKSAI